MTTGPQTMFVVEYPCDQFCRIEIDLSAEREQVTLRQLRDKADEAHQRAHAPETGETGETGEADAPAAAQESVGRPAATVFLSAPGSSASSPPSGRGGHKRR
jgi:hypothetical protein